MKDTVLTEEELVEARRVGALMRLVRSRVGEIEGFALRLGDRAILTEWEGGRQNVWDLVSDIRIMLGHAAGHDIFGHEVDKESLPGNVQELRENVLEDVMEGLCLGLEDVRDVSYKKRKAEERLDDLIAACIAEAK